MTITVQLEMDDNPTYGHDLEEEITQTLGKEIAKEIDNGILYDLMKSYGWNEVTISGTVHADIIKWCVENCQGPFRQYNNHFIFEEAKDATWFALRWSS